jgi:hypothetical protein
MGQARLYVFEAARVIERIRSRHAEPPPTASSDAGGAAASARGRAADARGTAADARGAAPDPRGGVSDAHAGAAARPVRDGLAGRRAPSRGPSADALEMLERLPGGMLHHTAAGYPHVLEAIARDWAEPARLHATLDALVFDLRGGRRGFPAEVLAELAELRRCHERWVGPRTPLGR